MALEGTTIMPASEFYKDLFSDANKNQIGFELQVHAKYQKLVDLYNDPNYVVDVTCVPDDCTGTSTAWTRPNKKQINLCDPWFDDSVRAPTTTISMQCKAGSPDSSKWDNLDKFRNSKGD